MKLLVFKSANPTDYESGGYYHSIGTTTTDILVPQKSAYENCPLSEAIRGTIIEPITFETHKYTYSGKAPIVSYTSNIDISKPNIKVEDIDVGEYQASFHVYCTDAGTTLNIPYNYTIDKAFLFVDIKNVQREYGENNPTLSDYTISGFVNNENEDVLSDPIVLSTKATAQSDVGTYSITCHPSARNYDFVINEGVLTVTAAPLSIKVDDCSREYGKENPIFACKYNGLKNNDIPKSSNDFVFETASVMADVGTYPIKCSGGKIKNYEIVEYKDGSLTITKAPLTLTANNKSRFYFEDNPAFDFTVSGLRNNDTKSCLAEHPTYVCSASKTSNAGVYDIILSGATANNYSIKYKIGILTVNQRSLTASVGNYTKVYGATNPEFEVTYSGFVNGEDTSVLSNMAKTVCSADEKSDVGNYTISVTGGDATNYAISTYKPGTLTISKADQTLTWNQDLSNVEQYAQVALKATSSAGLAVTYEMSPNNAALLYQSGSTWYLNCYGSGAVSIRAIQNGDKNHNAATILTKTLVVSASSGGSAAPQIYLNVEKAGTLPSLIAENRKYQIKNLRLTGYLNGTDIKYLREMAGSDANGNATAGILETLDISGCATVSGGSSYYSSYRTSNNVIGSYMFYNCKTLVNLMLPNDTKTIGVCALADCGRLSTIFIPEGVTSFDDKAFRNDISMNRIFMPNTLTSIGDMAFMGCNGLTVLTLPKSVEPVLSLVPRSIGLRIAL